MKFATNYNTYQNRFSRPLYAYYSTNTITFYFSWAKEELERSLHYVSHILMYNGRLLKQISVVPLILNAVLNARPARVLCTTLGPLNVQHRSPANRIAPLEYSILCIKSRPALLRWSLVAHQFYFEPKSGKITGKRIARCGWLEWPARTWRGHLWSPAECLFEINTLVLLMQLHVYVLSFICLSTSTK